MAPEKYLGATGLVRDEPLSGKLLKDVSCEEADGDAKGDGAQGPEDVDVRGSGGGFCVEGLGQLTFGVVNVFIGVGVGDPDGAEAFLGGGHLGEIALGEGHVELFGEEEEGLADGAERAFLIVDGVTAFALT